MGSLRRKRLVFSLCFPLLSIKDGAFQEVLELKMERNNKTKANLFIGKLCLRDEMQQLMLFILLILIIIIMYLYNIFHFYFY